MPFHKHIHLVGTVTVGPKGQVVIPSEAREDMGLQPGDKLLALYFDDKKSVSFITEKQAQEHIIKIGEEFTSFKDQMNKQRDTAPEGWD